MNDDYNAVLRALNDTLLFSCLPFVVVTCFFITKNLFTQQVQRCMCRNLIHTVKMLLRPCSVMLCTIKYFLNVGVTKRKLNNWEYLINSYPLQIVCPMATCFVEILKLLLLNYFSLNNSLEVNSYLGHPFYSPLSCSRHRSAAQSVSAQLEWSR